MYEGGRNNVLVNATALPLSEDPAGSGLWLGRGLGRQDPALPNTNWSDPDYWRIELQAGDWVTMSVDTPESDVDAYVAAATQVAETATPARATSIPMASRSRFNRPTTSATTVRVVRRSACTASPSPTPR